MRNSIMNILGVLTITSVLLFGTSVLATNEGAKSKAQSESTTLPRLAGDKGNLALDSLDAYNVAWDSPSRDSHGSMPLGNGDIGINAWVEESGDLERQESLWIVPHVDPHFLFCTWLEPDCADGLALVGNRRGVRRDLVAKLAADRLSLWRGPIDRILTDHAAPGGAGLSGEPWNRPWTSNEMLFPPEPPPLPVIPRKIARASGQAAPAKAPCGAHAVQRNFIFSC